MHLITTLISLGLDSFLACCLIGMSSLTWQQRAYLACGFGAWDAFGSMLGTMWPHASQTLYAAFGVAAFLYVRCGPRGRWPLYALPVLCSLDNLFTGTPAMIAPAIAASSALLAVVGLCVGESLHRMVVALNKSRVALRGASSGV